MAKIVKFCRFVYLLQAISKNVKRCEWCHLIWAALYISFFHDTSAV